MLEQRELRLSPDSVTTGFVRLTCGRYSTRRSKQKETQSFICSSRENSVSHRAVPRRNSVAGRIDDVRLNVLESEKETLLEMHVHVEWSLTVNSPRRSSFGRRRNDVQHDDLKRGRVTNLKMNVHVG